MHDGRPARGSAGRPEGSSGPPFLLVGTSAGSGSAVRPTRAVTLDGVRMAVLGGGRMGEALIAGLCDAGWDADRLVVAEPEPDRRHRLDARYPGVQVVPSAAWAVAGVETVVVAVKPGDVAVVLDGACASLAPDALVVSIAAGIRLAELEQAVPGRPVVRAMPNTAALVGRSASAIAPGTHAGEEHLARAESILSAVGTVVRVPEALLDAVTGLSGSGPAYVFLVAEALIEAGVLNGLPRPTSVALVEQTLLGAATLLSDGDDTPEVLRAAVTSPGGTTAAGLAALEARSVRAAFLDAVTAATRRSQEMGRP